MTARFSAQRFCERLGALGGDCLREIAVLDEIDSTSSELRRRLLAGGPRNAIVVAHRQTGGRGRLGRVWHSPPEGNLCISVALEVPGPTATTVPLLPLAAGVSLRDAVTEAGAEAFLKWPNDLLVSGRKVAGILCEAISLKDEGALVIVGLGVNIADRPFPGEIAKTAGALNRALGREVDMSLLAARFLASLETWNRRFGRGEGQEAPAAWRRGAEPFGRRVRVGEITGKTADLLEDGRLIVLTDAGDAVTVAGGIVESLELI